MYHCIQKILKQHSCYSLTSIDLCAQYLRLHTDQKSHWIKYNVKLVKNENKCKIWNLVFYLVIYMYV